MWTKISFTQSFFKGVTLNTSLSESIKFTGDYISASFINEFDSYIDTTDFEKQLVAAKPSFSNENEFKKDFQMTLDENLINNFLLALFNTKKVFSLTAVLLEITPDNMQNLVKMASNFFTTSFFNPIFPGISKEHGMQKKIDIKCGFSKSFLDGNVDEINIS